MAMIDQLKTIGIEKGKPFNPDAEVTADSERRHRVKRMPGWITNTRRSIPPPPSILTVTGQLPASKDLIKARDEPFRGYRMLIRSTAVASPIPMAFFSRQASRSGQYYLFAIRDKDGKPFDGANSYRLHVPPNVPVKQYWSVTAYDRATHGADSRHEVVEPFVADAGPAEECRWFGRYLLRVSSRRTGKESNWVPTSAERKVRSALPSLRSGEAALR